MAVGTLAFFPWLRIEERVDVGPYALLPYKRGASPGGAGTDLQEVIDKVLEPYRNGSSRPVDNAVILQVAGKDLTHDLDDAQVDELFAFAELLAFSGLKAREFFGLGFWYVNRDHFTLVVQRFPESVDAVAITSRRRDGFTRDLVDLSAYRVSRPAHVSTLFVGAPIDWDMLKALLDARDKLADEEWSRYWEAILAFNQANTDDYKISEFTELVLMVGAMQRFLDSPSDKDALAERFRRAFTPTMDLPLGSCTRLRSSGASARFRESSTIREVWIRNLWIARNPAAHGRLILPPGNLWTIKEHLLLVANAFPLLVKLDLARHGLCSLTEDDQLEIDVFEERACRGPFEQVDRAWVWNAVRGREAFRRATARAAEEAWELAFGPEPETAQDGPGQGEDGDNDKSGCDPRCGAQ